MTPRPRGARRAPVLALSAALVVLLAACAGGADAPPGTERTTGSEDRSGEPEGEVAVFAAASLAAAFDEIATLAQERYPALTVRLTTDGSATLVTQLEQGAPADVLATADEATMAGAAEAGLVLEPASFATNVLVIAVPAGNPEGVTSLGDLVTLDVVTCAPEVPCGAAAARAFDAADVDVAPVSEEQAVSAVVAKVAAGEADAGLVYATDVLGAESELESVEIPDAPVNTYPIAVAAGSPNPAAADAFVELVLSEEGQRVLAAHGFSP
ncbi:molybdenum ABC transporter, periplasmic molybdate-binding protein [Beutenbergia cavernae DSM 12333]|uniref:Molybdenum ABC transporter, periplasmic molybdate-binding protein n=1 Tax=Beutenbergia cavernae (strain ATCC BAA-8 / DSM 12333 / CCUG 43141 / JCM 11478 / NBRC 16432 / NCIMB 13614 / HKI 0122) TaxID=471853 RepID=C5C1M3_BEUC1|nr:molybdate ABC transporter substrate-binding protein [Beutenbergia cavernae]ACQ79491.1 molybdenum ABC transporter, periplasmic molybdate-binding protein [Beutenbergia cavernae DSM 12333]